MRLIIFTNFIEKLHVNLKPFYDLLQENTAWLWTTEHGTLFHNLKNALTSDTELTIHTLYQKSLFITFDAPFNGPGVYFFDKNKNTLH